MFTRLYSGNSDIQYSYITKLFDYCGTDKYLNYYVFLIILVLELTHLFYDLFSFRSKSQQKNCAKWKREESVQQPVSGKPK